MVSQNLLFLRNPHSVLAAIERRPQDVVDITVAKEERDREEAWNRVVQAAKKNSIKIKELESVPASSPAPDRGKSNRRPQRSRGGKPQKDPKKKVDPASRGRRGQAFARVHPLEGVGIKELFSQSSNSESHGLWIALDCLQDPGNVGAIFRTAAFFGARGVLLTDDRSASLSETVYDVACGALEHVPFSIQTNLKRALVDAKNAADLWILGTSEHDSSDRNQGFLGQFQLDRDWLVVMGNEEKGIRRLTREACDSICQIPAQGPIGSLNVSVATGVILGHFLGKKSDQSDTDRD